MSVTERGTFRECRRRWFWEYGLRKAPKAPQMNLWFGTGIHAALAAYYGAILLGSGSPLDAALGEFEAWYDAEMLDPQKQDRWFQFNELYELGIGMLRNYATYDREFPLTALGDVVSVEEETQIVPVLDLNREPVPDVYLAGRIDLTLQRRDGRFVIVDHKTRTTAQNAQALEIDDQLTGYCYLHWRTTGKVPALAIYNVLIKRVPEPPKVLKNGDLSLDIRQPTTYELYLLALRDRGYSNDNINDNDGGKYHAILTYLQSPAAWERFFQREITTRNEAEMLSFERRLYYEVMDMLAVRERKELRYPGPSPFRCGHCPYLQPCKASEDGGDADALLEYLYTEVEPRYKINK